MTHIITGAAMRSRRNAPAALVSALLSSVVFMALFASTAPAAQPGAPKVVSAHGGVLNASPLLASRGMIGVVSAQEAAWVAAVIRVIRRFGPAVWNACVNAGRRGAAAFRAWYNSLPRGWRFAIYMASRGSNTFTIYVALRDAGVFGGMQAASTIQPANLTVRAA